jgi:hypothetical protein
VLAHCECLECLECLRIVREKMRVGGVMVGWGVTYACNQRLLSLQSMFQRLLSLQSFSAIAIAAVIFPVIVIRAGVVFS